MLSLSLSLFFSPFSFLSHSSHPSFLLPLPPSISLPPSHPSLSLPPSLSLSPSLPPTPPSLSSLFLPPTPHSPFLSLSLSLSHPSLPLLFISFFFFFSSNRYMKGTQERGSILGSVEDIVLTLDDNAMNLQVCILVVLVLSLVMHCFL